ncbi:MAG: hypothetical protein ABI618_02785 [Nitrospirota bacterium]
MKRVFLVCAIVVFLFGISSVSFAAGMGDEMKDQPGTMKEEGMKKGDETMGDVKGKEEEIELSTGVKSKDMPDKIEAQGKEKVGKTKKKPMKEKPMEK